MKNRMKIILWLFSLVSINAFAYQLTLNVSSSIQRVIVGPVVKEDKCFVLPSDAGAHIYVQGQNTYKINIVVADIACTGQMAIRMWIKGGDSPIVVYFLSPNLGGVRYTIVWDDAVAEITNNRTISYIPSTQDIKYTGNGRIELYGVTDSDGSYNAVANIEVSGR